MGVSFNTSNQKVLLISGLPETRITSMAMSGVSDSATGGAATSTAKTLVTFVLCRDQGKLRCELKQKEHRIFVKGNDHVNEKLNHTRICLANLRQQLGLQPIYGTNGKNVQAPHVTAAFVQLF